MSEQEEAPTWGDYYRKVAQRPVRELFLQAVERFPAPGLALDLGCGGGIETRELLRRGWQVVAVDQEATAFEQLTDGLPAEQRARLTTLQASFETITLPEVDFIWAGLSLPFCPPAHFPQLWQQIPAALRPGGRFAGDLFGIRHAWRDDPALTFLSRAEVETLLETLEIEQLVEREEERETAFRGCQLWHGFDIIARRPPG